MTSMTTNLLKSLRILVFSHRLPLWRTWKNSAVHFLVAGFVEVAVYCDEVFGIWTRCRQKARKYNTVQSHTIRSWKLSHAMNKKTIQCNSINKTYHTLPYNTCGRGEREWMTIVINICHCCPGHFLFPHTSKSKNTKNTSDNSITTRSLWLHRGNVNTNSIMTNSLWGFKLAIYMSREIANILLMAEILHQFIGSLSHNF